MTTLPIFYVQADDGNGHFTYVPAKFLLDSSGEKVNDPAWGKTFYGNNGVSSNITPMNLNGKPGPYTLYDSGGNALKQEDQNNHGYMIVPADYKVADQLQAASDMTTSSTSGFQDPEASAMVEEAKFLAYFKPGSTGDLQHTYDGGKYGSSFVRAFTDIGAFNYGLLAAKMGLSPQAGA